MAPTGLRGGPVAAGIRETVTDRVRQLRDEGTVPTLGTVLMSDADADERFMTLKHDACEDAGIATRDRRLSPDVPAATLYETVAGLSEAPAVDAVFVQTPLPDHVSLAELRQRVSPSKDVDCFHPVNLGRLVGGNPRFVPATTAAVCRLLSHYDIELSGDHVAVVGRSAAIGRPLANRLLWDAEPGNATVTVCHSRTDDLGAITRRADVVVTACGVPELVDGSMLSTGVVVVDVSANHVGDDGETRVVGDVDYESAWKKAAAITPMPGGVGPVTVAALLENVVEAAERR